MARSVPQSRLRIWVGLFGLILGLFSLATPWVRIEADQVGETGLVWSTLAPASLSVATAAAAAWALGLLLKPVGIRIVSVVTAGLSVAALALAISAWSNTDQVAVSQADQIVGISGLITAQDLVITPVFWALALSLISVAVLAAAGVFGLIWPENRSASTNRYERRTSDGPADTWDQLSQGEDPTNP